MAPNYQTATIHDPVYVILLRYSHTVQHSDCSSVACWWCNSTTMTSERAREPAAGPVSPPRPAAAGPASPARRAVHLRRVLRTIPGIYLLLSTYTSLCYYIITLVKLTNAYPQLDEVQVRVGKTGSLRPWSRIIVYCSKLSFCQNDPPMHWKQAFLLSK